MTHFSKGKRANVEALRRCSCCKTSFKPHVRLGPRQETCGSVNCRRIHFARYLKQWRIENQEFEEGYEQKRKEDRPKDYWKEYRKQNPESTSRNREQSKLRARLKRKSLQRNIDILEVAESSAKSHAFAGFATLHRCSILKVFGNEDAS